MRFSAPRSTSPSPVRGSYRSQSTYGITSESSDNDSEGDSDVSDSESIASTSTDSFMYKSESEVPPAPPRPERPPRSLAEQHYVEDAIASIRLRVNHYDPWEEWEKETKQESFRTARVEQSLSKAQRHKNIKQAHTEQAQRRAAQHKQQMADVEAQLAALALRRQNEERMLRERWNERNKRIWDRIEGVIRIEEEKVRVKLEAERKKREEEERVRREEEERVQREEEMKRKEEEERARKAREEEESKKRAEEAERQKREKEEKEAGERKALGITTAMDDWKRARKLLKLLKAGPLRNVKEDKALKTIWSAGRRAITPKVGQLTNDPQSIVRVTRQIIDIIQPTDAHPENVYYALLSSLAKAIILQAEVEVSADKRSAIPLAQMTARLLGSLEGFSDILWARLCHRAGGWPVPIIVPPTDIDGAPFDATQRRKVLGYKEQEETLIDHTTRLTGMMRVYFHVLFVPVDLPLDPMFRLPRFWNYFARMLSDAQLLESSLAPSMLHVALDVGGAEARDIWGPQWVKVLEQLYEGVTTGLHGSNGRLIGGTASEGIAARVRVQLEIERIMKTT